MNYLNQMYGLKKSQESSKTSDKNPNRVSGGLKAQGADHYEFLGEDGTVQNIPTQRYVQSLEEQLRKQRAAINVLEKKLSRCDNAIDQLSSMINQR